jgi:excisionase family DNA binding protein
VSDLLLVDLDEAARRLSLSRRFVQGEIAAGRLHSVRAGRRRLVAVAALQDYIAENEDRHEDSRLIAIRGGRGAARRMRA